MNQNMERRNETVSEIPEVAAGSRESGLYLSRLRMQITDDHIVKFGENLKREEKSPVTIQKYLRDVRRFVEYMDHMEGAQIVGYAEQTGDRHDPEHRREKYARNPESERSRCFARMNPEGTQNTGINNPFPRETVAAGWKGNADFTGMTSGEDDSANSAIDGIDERPNVDSLLNAAIQWKETLQQTYAPRSINSMLASLNSFLAWMNYPNCRIKYLRIQQPAYRASREELTREEYIRLCEEAERQGDIRTSLVMQTLCSTGIRVSELKYITVEAAQRGEARVSCKAKIRTVFLVKALQTKLVRYARERNLESGPVFRTNQNGMLDRTSIWKKMNALSRSAGVCPDKVYPHNLRHLFARSFYEIDRDIAKLSDILGHSSVNTTRLYLISTGAEHRQRMEQMKLVL